MDEERYVQYATKDFQGIEIPLFYVPYVELEDDEVALVESPDRDTRIFAIEQEGLGLDYLSRDPHFEVRAAVARLGYGLGQLRHDNSYQVKIAALEGAIRINDMETVDILAKDEHVQVRIAVAKTGLRNDELRDDPIDFVREAVAKSEGRKWWLPEAPDEQGAEQQDSPTPEKEFKATLIESAERNPNIYFKKAVDKVAYKSGVYRRQIAEQIGMRKERMDNIVYGKSRLEPEEAERFLEVFSPRLTQRERDRVAATGRWWSNFEPGTLKKDRPTAPAIVDEREALAKEAELGYQRYETLDKRQRSYVNSKDRYKRMTAVDKGWGLDKLVKDKDWQVRATVAEQGFGLERLVYDTSINVRLEVAYQGFGCNALIKDDSDRVKDAVASYLKREGMTIRQWEEAYPEKCVEIKPHQPHDFDSPKRRARTQGEAPKPPERRSSPRQAERASRERPPTSPAYRDSDRSALKDSLARQRYNRLHRAR